jgi:hypothetical protein
LLWRNTNWFGVAGGAATIALISVSLFVPWWTLRVGDGFVEANASPLNTNFNFAGDTFTLPLIWALNLGAVFSLATGGITVLIYSFLPSKSYSKRLLDFGYRKPLYSVIFFFVSIIALILLMKSMFGFNIPIIGSGIIQLPQSMTPGIAISALVSADLQWPFWLGIITSGLCVVAKVYHKKITVTQISSPIKQ